MQFAYLGALLLSLLGMGLIDYRYKLALFLDARRTALTLLVGVAVFAVWDAFGIGLGIFINGDTRYVTGLLLAPHFPLEEVFFLLFLCYFTLVLYRLGEIKWPRT